MKRFLFLITLVLMMPSVTQASVVDQLKEMSQAAKELREIGYKIGQSAALRFPYDGAIYSKDVKQEAHQTAALSTISPCYNSAAFSIEQIVLMYMAFSESPLSAQGRELVSLSKREIQHLYYNGNYVHMLFSDMFESMAPKDKELCVKGLELIEHALKQLELIIDQPSY
ncbi:hypothetical protein OAN24_02520 [Pseudodesulfovibrio sp.]|nr:hypothetical protein [Pseudodesulfovibrio sp.]